MKQLGIMGRGYFIVKRPPLEIKSIWLIQAEKFIDDSMQVIYMFTICFTYNIHLVTFPTLWLMSSCKSEKGNTMEHTVP